MSRLFGYYFLFLIFQGLLITKNILSPKCSMLLHDFMYIHFCSLYSYNLPNVLISRYRLYIILF